MKDGFDVVSHLRHWKVKLLDYGQNELLLGDPLRVNTELNLGTSLGQQSLQNTIGQILDMYRWNEVVSTTKNTQLLRIDYGFKECLQVFLSLPIDQPRHNQLGLYELVLGWKA